MPTPKLEHEEPTNQQPILPEQDEAKTQPTYNQEERTSATIATPRLTFTSFSAPQKILLGLSKLRVFKSLHPKISRLNYATLRLYKKLDKRIKLGLAISLAVIFIIVGVNMASQKSNASTNINTSGSHMIVQSANGSSSKVTIVSANNSSAGPAKSNSTTPSFTPIAPEGESQLARLGSKAYNSAHDSYTFDDLYLAEPLQVSEQALPSGFSSKDSAVSKVAESYSATIPISSTNGTGYLSTNSSSGKQTIIFSAGGLLIFVQSSYVHDADTWAGYLNSYN
jgi:hypothetical protein